MKNQLGLELLSFLGLPPVEQVRLAARLSCHWISCGLTQLPAAFNPLGYPDWSLKDDAQLRRQFISEMRECDVAISLGEGFSVRPDNAMISRKDEMDLMAEMGARGLGGVCMEGDRSRAIDEFAQLAVLAQERDMLATIEFGPQLEVSTLEDAMSVIRAVDQPNFGLLVDSMHFFRSGGDVAQLEALDPAVIFYAQLCDVPATEPDAGYFQEAMSARLAPGAGELPLAHFVAALPRDIPIGLEVPNLAMAQAEPDPLKRLQPVVAAAETVMARSR